jgi:protein TonB
VNKSYLLVFSVLFSLGACSNVPQPASPNYLDLVGNKDAVAKYWVVERRVAPYYPVAAKENNTSGCAEFVLLIDSNGKPQNIKLIKSFPGTTFSTAAYESLRKWQWTPSASNPQKQAVLTTIQIDFSTQNPLNHADAYKACKI